MERRTRRVKFTEHRTVTTVAANGSPRVIRITVTDPFATDSSSDDDNVTVAPRVRRYVEEIRFCEAESAPAIKAKSKALKGRGERNDDVSSVKPRKYRGVRQRKWGPFAAEIRVPSTRSRIWLGTFATAEEAAMAYDRAAIHHIGPNARTNFLTPPTMPVVDLETVSGCDCGRDSRKSLHSPTSVLRSNVNEEAEYGTEQETEPIELLPERKSTVVEEESKGSLFRDTYLLSDLSLAGECFWDSDQLFLDEEIKIQSTLPNSEISKEDKESEEFSFSLNEDFDFSSWDVDSFFEHHSSD